MHLGIEIGGTKLQLAVGDGRGSPFVELARRTVDRARGAVGIREQIVQAGRELIARHPIRSIGIGFGGPVDPVAGCVLRSFHIDGWDGFPLRDWVADGLGRPAALGNDSDLAGLAEASFGAGRGTRIVFYSNVGTGIGGALVIDGKLYTGSAGVACEVGHLRPGPDAETADRIVESHSAGLGIERAARRALAAAGGDDPAAADLIRRAGGSIDRVTGRTVAEAAVAGNPIAAVVFDDAIRTYGWAIAQVCTLLAPGVVVIGGGVAMMGEAAFLEPLRRQVRRYVYPPLLESVRLVPAELGEEVVVHGALALAAANC